MKTIFLKHTETSILGFNYQINKLNYLNLFSERINSYFTILENNIGELIIMYKWLGFLLYFFNIDMQNSYNLLNCNF